MSYGSIQWLPLTVGLTVLGLIFSYFAYKRRGIRSGTMGAAWSLLPVAAYMTGATEMLWKVGAAIGQFGTGFVFSGLASTGLTAGFFFSGITMSGLAIFSCGDGGVGATTSIFGVAGSLTTSSGRLDHNSTVIAGFEKDCLFQLKPKYNSAKNTLCTTRASMPAGSL